jgi:hypothetical protein
MNRKFIAKFSVLFCAKNEENNENRFSLLVDTRCENEPNWFIVWIIDQRLFSADETTIYQPIWQ